MKVKEIFRIKNNEEDDNMKVKWSLKKKLLVGGGLIGGLVLGVLAYGKNNEGESQTDDYFEDGNCEDYDSDGLEDEIEDKTEVETQE